jgi:hypothetical protein
LIQQATATIHLLVSKAGLTPQSTFPYGRHDDQVDSTAQMLDWFKAAGREDDIFAYYRMLYEERRKPALAKAGGQERG